MGDAQLRTDDSVLLFLSALRREGGAVLEALQLAGGRVGLEVALASMATFRSIACRLAAALPLPTPLELVELRADLKRAHRAIGRKLGVTYLDVASMSASEWFEVWVESGGPRG